MTAPIPVRKARAIALKLSAMPVDLWSGQLIAGSMTLEDPRVHAERGFPQYLTDAEIAEGRKRGWGTGCFGHIVPDYPRLLTRGIGGIRADAEAQLSRVRTGGERAFLDSVLVALDAVVAFAARLAAECEHAAMDTADRVRSTELQQMADNLRRAPAGPATTLWEALQSVWLLHMVFHSTLNGNAIGRLDQYAWPLLEADLKAGRIDAPAAMELVSCFCLKFNERAKTTDEQRPEGRDPQPGRATRRTRHATSSQIGNGRDGLDATNHWLQNIIIGGLTPDGGDGTNPLTYALLESYRRNEMTNPLLTVRLHRDSPAALLTTSCNVLKHGGGMPALFNDEVLVPAIERIGIPTADARDYTNDGCWETIVPGRTDFYFQRLSVVLPLEWVLNGGRSRIIQGMDGIDTGNPREFTSFEALWSAYVRQLGTMVARTIERRIETIDARGQLAPVPLLSALIQGPIETMRDMTLGGAKHRTFGVLAEGAAHAIDSLTAIKTVVFDRKQASMDDVCRALDEDYVGYESLRRKLASAPKYGNNDPDADAMGKRLLETFAGLVRQHAAPHEHAGKFLCGVATFSWYVGIGEGLGASPDGRHSGDPVSSNFSPALGRDMEGVPGAILSYAAMPHECLPEGGPLDLRLPRRLVEGAEGTQRMVALVRGFVDTGGSMMTLTVADTEELRAAQREPEKHESLRVRMGGWSAYFTMLSREQQDHHIRRQEAAS